MDWHEAYLAQARSDHAVMRLLNAHSFPYCHQLHYLQMVAEKLAKGILTPAGAKAPAPAKHAVIVKMLQVLKNSPGIRRALRFRSAEAFTRYISSMLDLGRRMERLSPEQAGFTQPNPEYPWWKDRAAGRVWAPAEYSFPELHALSAQMSKLRSLIADLLHTAF